eukprot:9356085-Alexandrium_andersonii.AAC.1
MPERRARSCVPHFRCGLADAPLPGGCPRSYGRFCLEYPAAEPLAGEPFPVAGRSGVAVPGGARLAT